MLWRSRTKNKRSSSCPQTKSNLTYSSQCPTPTAWWRQPPSSRRNCLTCWIGHRIRRCRSSVHHTISTGSTTIWRSEEMMWVMARVATSSRTISLIRRATAHCPLLSRPSLRTRSTSTCSSSSMVSRQALQTCDHSGTVFRCCCQTQCSLCLKPMRRTLMRVLRILGSNLQLRCKSSYSITWTGREQGDMRSKHVCQSWHSLDTH